jgi:hypothetical protein
MSSTTPADRGGIQISPRPHISAAIPTTVGVLLTVAFFAAHQALSTGFFLAGFGSTEAALFYGSILYGIIVTNTAVFGLKEDRALVLDLIGGILWTVATVWLYLVFPFDFSNFAAVVPWPLQLMFSWVTNGIARIIWVLLVLGSAAFVPFFAIQLNGARRKKRE